MTGKEEFFEGSSKSVEEYKEKEEQAIDETEIEVTPKGVPVDLTGNQVEENVTPEDFGIEEAAGFIDPDIGTQDDPANDHRLSTVKPRKDIPEEYVIEYLYNPENKKIFPVNEAIVKQKHLVPCTKEGKLLPDNRRPSDFR